MTAYSSFGPQSFLEFNMKHAVQLTPLFEDETIKKIAAKYNRPASQVLLRWATQRGLAIIPKSTRPEIMKSNLESIEFDLSEEDIATISAFDRGLRFNQPTNVSFPLSSSNVITQVNDANYYRLQYFPTEHLWIFG